MKAFFYRVLIILSKRWGSWIFVLMSRFVAAGYYLLFPKRVSTGIRFYRALFPHESIFYHMLCVWKQFSNFTSVFMDRVLIQEIRDISYTMDGWNALENTLNKKKGAIILMSHFGNWEVAAHLFKERMSDIPVLLFMGRRPRDEIEDIQKQDLSEKGIKIITAGKGTSSPFDIVEAVRLLKSGGIVSLSGDILWRSGQRAVTASFLGLKVKVPEAPHLIALVSGAPLFIFFPFSTGKKRYHFVLHGPFFVKASSRADRAKVIQFSVQNYISLLEKAVQKSPFEWYHFDPFFE